MSRSRKKTPCCHLAGHDGSWKAIYNRMLRRAPINYAEGVSSLPDGMAYRKANCPWNISDLKEAHVTFGEFWSDDRDAYERLFVRK